MLKSIGNVHDCKHLYSTDDQTKRNDLKKIYIQTIIKETQLMYAVVFD